MSDEIPKLDKAKSKRTLKRLEETNRKKLLDEIKKRNYNHLRFDLKKLDKNGITYMYGNRFFDEQCSLIVSDFVYNKDKIYTESQYKYGVNSVDILTGEIYGNILGLFVDLTESDTVNKYNDVCDENIFDEHTVMMDGLNHELILFFRPNERQTNGLRGRDLSKIKLFDVDIDAYYNGQSMYGPMILNHNGEVFSCEFIIKSVKYGVAPLPDFIYDEIMRQLDKEEFVDKEIYQTDQQTNEIAEFKRYANEKLNEFVNGENFDMVNKEHMMIKFCEAYLKTKIIKFNVLSIDFIKMYCENFLIFTKEIEDGVKEDEIKGTKLVQRCGEQLGDKQLLPQKVYSFLDINGLSYRILNGMRYFIYVKFRNPSDYE